MVRNVLIFCTATFAAVCLLCFWGMPTQALAASICPAGTTDGETFANEVKVLDTGFDPTVNPYTRPSGTASPSPKGSVHYDLKQAFNNAPQKVRDHLCALSGAFINPTGCPNGDVDKCQPFSGHLFSGNSSWGFRSWRGGHGEKGNTYVLISGGLWNTAGASAITFSQYQNALLTFYLNHSRPSGWPLPWPTIQSATPDTPWMTVLAALAHELGHVRWAVTNIPNGAGNNWDFDLLRNCPITGGTTDFFIGWDYDPQKADKQLAPSKRWRTFADCSDDESTGANKKCIEHAMSPLLEDFSNANINQLNPLLYKLYAPDNGLQQPWASLFGAQAPDEDFAEMYVLYALFANSFSGGSYLMNLPVTIPGSPTADVAQDLRSNRKTAVAKKLACLGGLP